MYRTRNTKATKVLLEQNKKIFRTADLAVLWEIENKNTLWTMIKRYVQRQILYRIHRGLYSITPLEKLHKYELGCAVVGPFSYVSAETVLQNAGVIMQNVSVVTLMGKKTKKIIIQGTEYWSRRLNAKYLLNRAGIVENERFAVASLERAVVDMQHFNPKYYFDNKMAINEEKIKQIKKEVGYL